MVDRNTGPVLERGSGDVVIIAYGQDRRVWIPPTNDRIPDGLSRWLE